MLKTGQRAPEFTLPRDGGGSVMFSGLGPDAIVLYFYPRDDTSGCTKESIAFTELLPEFHGIGVQVFGISKDSVRKHERFRDKHMLSVALLSDEDSDVCERYGVWVEKQMYGRKFMGIERSTVLIDGKGLVRKIWRKVKVPGHAAAVLEAASSMQLSTKDS